MKVRFPPGRGMNDIRFGAETQKEKPPIFMLPLCLAGADCRIPGRFIACIQLLKTTIKEKYF
ncbi:MAG: hypothetical protein IJ214_10320 [Clostridia bacterium]|nr:hypothetical protein [Clostridia bacterium]